MNRHRVCQINLVTLLLLSGCATPCGILNYCDIPEGWPVSDTFTVRASDSRLCVSGNRRSSCASKGIYQVGSRAVEIHLIDDEEDDDYDDSRLLATLTVTGVAGEEFTASCYQYNGNKVLGMTEVLTGAEIRDQAGSVVAVYPAHSVTRRNTLFSSC